MLSARGRLRDAYIGYAYAPLCVLTRPVSGDRPDLNRTKSPYIITPFFSTVAYVDQLRSESRLGSDRVRTQEYG